MLVSTGNFAGVSSAGEVQLTIKIRTNVVKKPTLKILFFHNFVFLIWLIRLIFVTLHFEIRCKDRINIGTFQIYDLLGKGKTKT